MHPDLWTVPGVDFTIPSYGFVCLVGFVLAIWVAVRRAKGIGCDAQAVTTVALIGGVLGILGSRGMQLVHHFWDRIRTGEMGAGEAVTTIYEGGEILGGVLLGTAGVIVYLAVRRKPIRVYLDIIVGPLILAMGIGRLGCLMAGCCWGAVCTTEVGDKSLPWAIRFPYGSQAYIQQWVDGQLTVPNELLWISPQTKASRPIPRKLLSDDAPELDETLAAYRDKFLTLAELRKADPDGAEAAQCRQELRTLEASLPGESKKERGQYATAAIHLARLSNSREDAARVGLTDLCRLAAGQCSLWVHPTQVYDALALLFLFLVLSVVFYRRQRPGMVVAWAMLLYPVGRFTQEFIRADNPRDVGALTISQFLSLVMFLLGLIYLILLFKVLPAGRDQIAPGKNSMAS
ncbi:MAG: prolipoprotein diacylglyceryl transferase [Planctomycetota bacterium]|jgi:phosphatidylglycerol:prolipoprotein diacylglycerol transferase